MEVKHDHRVEHAAGLQDLDGLQHLRGRQAELRRLAAGLRPLARAAGIELGAHAEQRPDAARLRHGKDALELGDLLQDEDDLLFHPHGV